ncbi:MAG: hypothetical protein ACYDHG_10625 [Desulfomonilaceae bacterium]
MSFRASVATRAPIPTALPWAIMAPGPYGANKYVRISIAFNDPVGVTQNSP